MNKAIIMGRATRDPEIRNTQGANATTIASMSIAVDRRFKREGEPDADFFNLTAFGKQAEFIEKYIKKGTKVVVEGRMQNDTYTNKDGQKVTAMKIIIESIEFAESKAASQSVSEEQKANTTPDGFMNVPEGELDDLPFA